MALDEIVPIGVTMLVPLMLVGGMSRDVSAQSRLKVDAIATVCDIVRDPARYREEEVLLTADILPSGHGTLLVDSSCDGHAAGLSFAVGPSIDPSVLLLSSVLSPSSGGSYVRRRITATLLGTFRWDGTQAPKYTLNLRRVLSITLVPIPEPDR
jgi:hypothetical protein